MSAKVENLIYSMTRREPRPELPKKILVVRDRNVDFGLGKIGVLKPVMGNRFEKNKYTHVLFRGALHSASISRGLYGSPIVWIDQL